MPYIKKDRRTLLTFHPYEAHTAGELNFVITNLCLDFLGLDYRKKGGYPKLNEVIGVLECVKQEMYRRAVAPYEDIKIAENGDLDW